MFEYEVCESVLSRYLNGTSTRLLIICVYGELYIASIYFSNMFIYIKESNSFYQGYYSIVKSTMFGISNTRSIDVIKSSMHIVKPIIIFLLLSFFLNILCVKYIRYAMVSGVQRAITNQRIMKRSLRVGGV